MAIGRTEERDTARDSVMLRHRESVCDPIRVTHLGQRSIRPHSKAGHMTAIDQTCPRCKKTLRGGGRPHMSQRPRSTLLTTQAGSFFHAVFMDYQDKEEQKAIFNLYISAPTTLRAPVG